MSKFSKIATATALLLSAATSQAITVVYTFNSTAVSAFGSAPFGTVSLTESGSNIDVEVKLRSDMNFVTTGGHTLFAFNAANTAVTDIINISDATPRAGEYAAFKTGSGGYDAVNPPFGTFLYGIECVLCKNGAGDKQAGPLRFTVKDAALIDFANQSDGGIAAYFSADVITGVNTGAVGATGQGVPVTPVPEPETYALMLAGLGVMGFIARRRKQQA